MANQDAQQTQQSIEFDKALLAVRAKFQEKYPNHVFKFTDDAIDMGNVNPLLLEFEKALLAVRDQYAKDDPQTYYKVFSVSVKAPPKAKVLSRMKHTSDETAIYHQDD